MKKIKLKFTVNNKPYELEVNPNARLLDVLRDELNLTGTKEGCGVGECGACTVIMNGQAVNSCLVLAGQAQGAKIITIEGVQGENGELHPIQQAFIDKGAVQCGYCTPGMILSAKALLDQNPNPTVEEIKEGISGNLCRCTGYQQIIEAVQEAAKRME
ncbi:(2Fe-2S)-binding protein [Anoxybacter fermentans]|uniref:(2Fe-2S)-binding protein n=1 Tax=Anoxybacter fermentans TaxID=1323375 RepID=A0A3S9SWD3_9FIRM|nr:(2Fe-2S)-binding protein [Anoxybacter fermentans]AZR72585.1 (2Fe-2S)-binding protein [Anoxybacter fermentans]